MLTPVAAGVLVHESQFMMSNAVVVQGDAGVLLIDAGVLGDEMVALANDLRDLGQPIVAAFSTHPHWDHVLWHAEFGEAPRYGTANCATAIRAALSNPNWRDVVVSLIPPDIVGQVPLDLLGLITGLPPDTTNIPWDGPQVRIIEHQAHASGHAALLMAERRVLVAGDMLSDIVIPMLNLNGANPIEDYLEALDRREGVAGDVDVVIPGHGSVGHAGQLMERIAQDRAYVQALRDGDDSGDPRLGPSAYGKDFLPGVHERQLSVRTPP